MNELVPLLGRFLSAAKELSIPVVVGGGFALATWGRSRPADAIEAIVDLREAQVPGFVASLRSRNLSVTQEEVIGALKGKVHFSIADGESQYHVLARAPYSQHDKNTLESRVYTEYQGAPLPVSGLEDTVANRVRLGGEQDLEDAMLILVRNWDNIDWPRLEALCAAYGKQMELKAVQRRASRTLHPKKPAHQHHRHR